VFIMVITCLKWVTKPRKICLFVPLGFFLENQKTKPETSKKNSRLNYFVHVNTVTLSFHSFYCMKYKCSCFAFEVVLHIFGGIIEIYHACKWYLLNNTGFETRQISLACRLGKFVQSLNQYFLANTTYKHNIFLYNRLSLSPLHWGHYSIALHCHVEVTAEAIALHGTDNNTFSSRSSMFQQYIFSLKFQFSFYQYCLAYKKAGFFFACISLH
jgi:hypothetical protein